MGKLSITSISKLAILGSLALLMIGCARNRQTTPPPEISLPLLAPQEETLWQAPLGADLTAPAQASLPELRDIPRYQIRLEIGPQGYKFNGELTLTYTNTTGASLDALYLRLLPNGGKSYGGGSLVTSRWQVDGKAVTAELSQEDTVLRIPLDAALADGAPVRVSMDFAGQTPLDFGSEDGYGIYNFTEGVLALASWYPILAVYQDGGWRLDPVSLIGDSVFSEMAAYSVEVYAAPDWTVVTSGSLMERSNVDKSTTRQRFAASPARDFFVAAGKDLQGDSRQVGNTTVTAYSRRADQAANAAALDVAAYALQAYSKRFGAYPFKEMDVVQAPLKNAAGVEYPGLFLIGESYYANPNDPFFITVIAHETAHQWWYNVVGNDVFNEPWLDEALTTYSAGIYYEERFGSGAYQEYRSYWVGSYQKKLDEGRDRPVADSLADFEANDPGAYGAVVYNKGALFFDALRAEIGDQAFFAALQEYYQTYAYHIANGQNLLALFERHAGRELDALYTEWLFHK